MATLSYKALKTTIDEVMLKKIRLVGTIQNTWDSCCIHCMAYARLSLVPTDPLNPCPDIPFKLHMS